MHQAQQAADEGIHLVQRRQEGQVDDITPCACLEIGDHVIDAGRGQAIGIAPAAAGQRVAPRARRDQHEDVVAAIAINAVAAIPAPRYIVAIERVIAIAAAQRVIAGAANQYVVPGPAIQQVIAGQAQQVVGDGTAVQCVALGGTRGVLDPGQSVRAVSGRGAGLQIDDDAGADHSWRR